MCAMPVSSEVFGDPCPNTRKYVEVHFACMPINEYFAKRNSMPSLTFIRYSYFTKLNEIMFLYQFLYL